ncbi:MAG TPA: RNA-binding protein [Chloroflexia bacterium]|nr:RNA-binding protein [Chloroflexia bacterium]
MSKRLYVGNLSEQTDEKSLKQVFSQLGNVEVVNILTNKGISRGFGFVEMSSEREALNAINTLNGSELNGQAIVVNEANPPGGRRDEGNSGGFGRARRRFAR